MLTVKKVSADDVVPLRMRVLRQGLPASESRWTGDLLATTTHFAAYDEQGAIVGIATVMAHPWPGPASGEPDVPPAGQGPNWQLRGMAVDPALQRGGVGRALLDALVAHVDAPLWCNARVSALGFYERLGWRPFGVPYDIPHAGPHVRMMFTPR